MTKGFFDETREQSEIKARLIEKYFWAWANVVMPTARKLARGRIAYIDLFAGPGRYKDGTDSTPLRILKRAIEDPKMRSSLVTLFNDVDSNYSRSLERAIAALPGIETLRYPPQVENEEVGDEIVKMFEDRRLIPTLFFVDPWGYKGLSLRLVNSVIKDWGCDCVFFFNYNRINMGLSNPLVRAHMHALFGSERAEVLRREIECMEPDDRKLTIVNALAEALSENGKRFVLPFCFKNAQGNRTSHHLIFVSKNFRGYEIMKDIMAKECSGTQESGASFVYNPASVRQPLLFALSRPQDDLPDLLAEQFRGQTLRMAEVYQQHSVGTPFVKKDYKAALLRLERDHRITCQPPSSRRRTDTLADTVAVTFPVIESVSRPRDARSAGLNDLY